MLYHTVLFQFADDTEQATIDGVLDSLRGLEGVPAVQSIVVGENTMPPGDGWTHGMTIEFANQKSMVEEFGDHPLHQAVVRDQIPVFSRYMAMDVNSDPTEKGFRDDHDFS